MVCPVQIGNLRTPSVEQGKELDPADLDPRNMAYPLMHALVHFLDDPAQDLSTGSKAVEHEIRLIGDQLAALQKRGSSIFGRATLCNEIRLKQQLLRELKEMLEPSTGIWAKLVAELELAVVEHRVAIFESGQRARAEARS